MAKKERELVFKKTMDGKILCECAGCRWKVWTPAVMSEPGGQTAEREFSFHHCEAYPLREDSVKAR